MTFHFRFIIVRKWTISSRMKHKSNKTINSKADNSPMRNKTIAETIPNIDIKDDFM